MLLIKDLEIKVGDVHIYVKNISVDKYEYCILLGPSGVGKTLLLNSIVGFIKPLRGSIIIDDIDVTNLPPEKRGIAIVPQNFALFPHMSVYDNLAFPLKIKKLNKREIERRIIEISRLLEIENVLNRKPSTLSAGEAQRVAIARALLSEPRVLLLDEPLSNLDPGRKLSAMRLLHSLCKERDIYIIHVTHDIAEAVILGDKIYYMSGGEIVFEGTSREFLESIYARPYIDLIKKVFEVYSLARSPL